MTQLLHFIKSLDVSALRLVSRQLVGHDRCPIFALPLQVRSVLFHSVLHIPVRLLQVVLCHFPIFLLSISTFTA
jgi:hypothetical protein